MNKRVITVLFSFLIIFIGAAPITFAGMHGSDKGSSGSGHMSGGTHGGGNGNMMHKGENKGGHHMGGDQGESMHHNSMGNTLFNESVFGRTLQGTIVDVAAKLAAIGGNMKAPAGVTHHLMLSPDTPFEKGIDATLQIKYPDGKERNVSLQTMGNHIGGDLNLDAKGKYLFKCLIKEGSHEKIIPFTYKIN